MTKHHLAIAMEYAPGGDLSEYVDACKRAGVSGHSLFAGMSASAESAWLCRSWRAFLRPNAGCCSLGGCQKRMQGGSSSSSSSQWTTVTGLALPTATSR